MIKRGQGIQFNWIFVLVISVIILLFFSGFIIKYIDLQESKQNAQIAKMFSNSILSMKTTEQYKNFSVSSKFKLDYNCKEIIINEDSKLDIPYVIVTDGFDTNNLVMWVKEYKKGFLIDRVVFITDANKKYYFDSKYRSNLPPNVNLVSNPHNADVVVSSTYKIEGKKNIDPSEMEDFFVYVAAFSNPNVYNCTKEKLDDTFDRLRKIYILKIQQVSMSAGALCNYNPLKNALENGDVNSIIDANEDLSRSGCEVIF